MLAFIEIKQGSFKKAERSSYQVRNKKTVFSKIFKKLIGIRKNNMSKTEV